MLYIHRYDVRGHLTDLSDFQTDSWNRTYQLSNEELRIETLCDEERYLALRKDLIEEQHRHGNFIQTFFWVCGNLELRLPRLKPC